MAAPGVAGAAIVFAVEPRDFDFEVRLPIGADMCNSSFPRIEIRCGRRQRVPLLPGTPCCRLHLRDPFAVLPCVERVCCAPGTHSPLPEALPRVRTEPPAGDQTRRDSELPPTSAHRPVARIRSGSGEPPRGRVLPARASSRHQAESVGRSLPVFHPDRGVSLFVLRSPSRLPATPTSSHERCLAGSHDPRYGR